MLTSVDFNNEALLKADEIKKKARKRDLTAKFEIREAIVAQQFPHTRFGVGGLSPHFLCEIADALGGRSMVRRLRHEPLIRLA